MKITDYMPRPGLIEVHLRGRDLVGVEIGVDAGAHAESMLLNCDIKQLTLIDPWDREFMYGYCVGRIQSKGFYHKVEFLKKTSMQALSIIIDNSLDFIYFDSVHDYDGVYNDAVCWLPKLKSDSIVSFRGYSFEGVKKAVDEFIQNTGWEHEHNEYLDEVTVWRGRK